MTFRVASSPVVDQLEAVAMDHDRHEPTARLSAGSDDQGQEDGGEQSAHGEEVRLGVRASHVSILSG